MVHVGYLEMWWFGRFATPEMVVCLLQGRIGSVVRLIGGMRGQKNTQMQELDHNTIGESEIRI